MANQFKPVILSQLGDPPPPTRAERDAVYGRIGEKFAMMLAQASASEREAHALEFGRAIAEVEAELAAPPAIARARPGTAVLAVVALATFAIVAAGSWYFFSARQQP